MATITKGDLTELKSLSKPPVGVTDVVTALILLMGHDMRLATDWHLCKKVISDTPKVIAFLQSKDTKTVDPAHVQFAKDKLAPYEADGLKKISMAAGNLFKCVSEIARSA